MVFAPMTAFLLTQSMRRSYPKSVTLHVQFFGQKSSADSTPSATRVARMTEAVRKWMMTTATKILGLNLIIAFILSVLHVASD